MTEKELENKLIRAVKTRGGKAYKFYSPGNSGVPDRLVLIPTGYPEGQAVAVGFVEVKKPGVGRLSRLQIAQIKKLKKLGAKCYVLDSDTFIESILDDIETGRYPAIRFGGRG